MFTWEDGHPYSPDYVSHTFHKLLKKYDLPHIRFHDLRHTCASMLLSEGYGLKDVQEWLGHSDIKMTANIYGHLDIRRKRSIANGLEQALPRLKALKTKMRQILSDLTLLLTLTAIFGPSGESRTHGLLNPIQARYQTALHPVNRAVSNQLYYYSGFE